MKFLKLINTRLDGRYDVQELIGRGSYAEIFEAEDVLASPQSPHRRVVIKALNVFLQNDLDHDLERTLVENFQNEAVALDRVRHPNVINRIGHGTARDLDGTIFHYLALEYLVGGDLAKACRNKRFSLHEALDYIEQVCAGLAFAHGKGVIHRDIKPQNLLLTEDQKVVKIADFGVARFSNSDTPVTRVGTNIYAPPEHSPMLAGQTGLLVSPKLTVAADIYSLAKTAFVLITGESPRSFANHPITELPFALRNQKWAKDLVRILEKATQADSSIRHQSINEFWQDLALVKRQNLSIEIDQTVRLSTSSIYAIPRPHVARGYQPFAPKVPSFSPAPEITIDSVEANRSLKNLDALSLDSTSLEKSRPIMVPVGNSPMPSPDFQPETRQRRRRSVFQRIALFAGLLLVFAGALFATQYYIRSNNLFPGLTRSFRAQQGVSTTDVNLRSKPNSAEDNRIGVVSKNSRLRILNEVDSWYEVEIIEHGRPPLNSGNADRGWVFGKYVKVENN